MRIVITGGAGFIGSTFADLALAAGHHVTVVDNFSSGTRANLASAADRYPDALVIHEADIRDRHVTTLIANCQPDVVVHFAAQIDVRLSVADPVADAMANVIGTLRVLEGARTGGARKFLFPSSGGAVHGSLADGEPPADEGARRHPESPYGVSKMVMIDYLRLYRELYDLDFTALALANVYGPRQDPFGEGGVVSIFGERLLRQDTCLIFGDGNQTRDFVFVKDVANAFLAALGGGSGEVFNIGTGVETSVNELFAVMARVAGVTAQPEYRPARPGEARRSCLDPGKAQRLLDWHPATSLPQGVAEVLAFLRQDS